MKKILAGLLCLIIIAGVLTGCAGAEPGAAEAEIVPQIAFILGPFADPALLEGAQKAAAQETVEIIKMGEDGADIVQQINTAVSSGYQAMVIAGVQMDEVSEALADAAASGMKFICADMMAHLNAEAVVAADQKIAGQMAGEAMIAALQSRGITQGSVGMVGVAEDTAARAREDGFRTALEKANYKLTETLYVENDPAAVQNMAVNYITQGIAGIFCSSEYATVGFGNAVKEASANMTVVGFGTSDALDALVRDGYIQAILSADYEQMGYEALKAAAAAVNGEVLGGKTINTEILLKKTEVSVQESVYSMMEAVFEEDCSEYRVALIAPSRFDPYWEALEEGAMKAAEALGCEVENLSHYMDDTDEQIDRIEDAVEEGFHAIVIASNDPQAITPALADAIDEGIRIICVNTYVELPVQATIYVNPWTAGKTAGETMLAWLEEKEIKEGSIGLVAVDEEDESALHREAGFRAAFENTAYTLLDTEYCEGDAAMAHSIALEYIEEEVVGIFCCNEAASIGAGNAVEEEDDAIVVGFGDLERIQELIEDEIILASIADQPEAMGYGAVAAACTALSGRNLGGAFMDFGVRVLTQE